MAYQSWDRNAQSHIILRESLYKSSLGRNSTRWRKIPRNERLREWISPPKEAIKILKNWTVLKLQPSLNIIGRFHDCVIGSKRVKNLRINIRMVSNSISWADDVQFISYLLIFGYSNLWIGILFTNLQNCKFCSFVSCLQFEVAVNFLASAH